jgi:hypothetical protein
MPTQNKWLLSVPHTANKDMKVLVTEFQLVVPALTISMTQKCENLHDKNFDHLKYKFTVSHKNKV